MRHDLLPWAGLAAVSTIALLLGFGQVVQHIVDQGRDRRAAERERYSATWRCKLLPTLQDRTDCRAALN
jgi:hypothetical protein